MNKSIRFLIILGLGLAIGYVTMDVEETPLVIKIISTTLLGGMILVTVLFFIIIKDK